VVVQPGLAPINNPGGAIAVPNVCIASVQMRKGPSIAYAPIEILTAGYEWILIQVGATSGYVPTASICL
jgi:hypothetical protein